MKASRGRGPPSSLERTYPRDTGDRSSHFHRVVAEICSRRGRAARLRPCRAPGSRDSARALSVPRATMDDSIAGQTWHTPLWLARETGITRHEVAARNRFVPTSGHGVRRRRSTAAAVRHDPALIATGHRTRQQLVCGQKSPDESDKVVLSEHEPECPRRSAFADL